MAKFKREVTIRVHEKFWPDLVLEPDRIYTFEFPLSISSDDAIEIRGTDLMGAGIVLRDYLAGCLRTSEPGVETIFTIGIVPRKRQKRAKHG